jgi:hypothetical protein
MSNKDMPLPAVPLLSADSVFWPLLWWVHHNCHERRCPWPGHPNADGVVYCRGHAKKERNTK